MDSGQAKGRGTTEVPSLLWWSVIGFVLWTVASTIASSTKNYGLDEVLQTTALGLLFLWFIRSSSRSQLHVHLPLFLTRLALLSCLIGLLVYIFQPVPRFVGTFVDPRFHTDYWPNAFAEFLLLAWPLCAHHFFSRSSKLTAHSLPIGFVLGCLLLTYSRGAWIAFIGQLILLLLLSSASIPPLCNLLPRIAAITLTAILTFAFANLARSSFFPVQPLREKVTFTAAEGGSSLSERRQFFSQAWQLSLKKPLLGFGPYSFRFVQPSLQRGIFETSDHPHNVFLKLAMERGWPSAVLFVLILVSVLLPALQKLANGKLPAPCYQLPALIAVGGVLAHNLIDYNLQFVGISLPFWLLLGSITASQESSNYPKRETSQRRIECALACLLLFVTVREGYFLVTSSLGRHAEVRGDAERALVWYERSEGEWFPRDLLLSEAQLLLFERGDADSAEAVLRSSLKHNAHDARTYRLLGDALRSQGNVDEAVNAYREAYRRGRFNDLSPVRALLSLHLQRGDPAPLATLKEELLTLLDAYRQAIAKNSHFIALGPNPEALLDIYQILQGVYPEHREEVAEWMKEVEREAAEERSNLRGRRGWLW